MTPEEHKARHVELHKALDELMADYLYHHPKELPSLIRLWDVVKWSHEQTLEPTAKE